MYERLAAFDCMTTTQNAILQGYDTYCYMSELTERKSNHTILNAERNEARND